MSSISSCSTDRVSSYRLIRILSDSVAVSCRIRLSFSTGTLSLHTMGSYLVVMAVALRLTALVLFGYGLLLSLVVLPLISSYLRTFGVANLRTVPLLLPTRGYCSCSRLTLLLTTALVVSDCILLWLTARIYRSIVQFDLLLPYLFFDQLAVSFFTASFTLSMKS